MLTLTLKKGVRFNLPDGGFIDMQIVRVNGNHVRVAIALPDDVTALRTEVLEREKKAAEVPAK